MKDTEINVFNYLKEFLSQRKLYFLIYLIIIPILPIIRNFVIPELTGKIYSNLKNTENTNNLLKLLALAFTIMPVTTCIVNFMAWRLIPIFYEFIVSKIYSYVYENTYCNYENINIGEIIIKISRMKAILINLLSTFKEDFLNIFIAVVFGFFYFYKKLNIHYFIIYLVFIILVTIVQIFHVKYISNLNKEKESVGDKVFSELTDSFNNISIVQNFENKPTEVNIIKQILQKYNNLFYQSLKNSLFFDIATKGLTLLWTLTFGYKLWKDYTSSKISKTDFYQITQVVIMLAFICDFFGIVGRGFSDELGDIYDINEFFKNEIPFDDKCNVGQNKFSDGDIVFENVYHKYNKSNNYALENINVTIKKGEKVAFIGQSGSGKSTMVKLLLKKNPLIMGNITINNTSVNDMSSKEIAANVFYIPQSPKLFNRTLYDNIVYGLKKPPSKEQIFEILQNLNMNEIADVFSEKMDKFVGKDGSSLSGGQRQIVWLLRSLFRMKPIVILDEPTAALDPESKKIVIEAIKKITAGKTVIVITHDDIIDEFKKINFKAGKQVDNDVFNMF